MSDRTDRPAESKSLQGLRIKRAFSDWDLHVTSCPNCKVHGIICATEGTLREALRQAGGEAR